MRLPRGQAASPVQKDLRDQMILEMKKILAIFRWTAENRYKLVFLEIEHRKNTPKHDTWLKLRIAALHCKAAQLGDLLLKQVTRMSTDSL